MNEQLVLERMNEVFIQVFDDQSISISRNTTANDIEDWDSLNHIQLMAALEKKFKVKFKAAEIQNFRNAGEIADAILKRL